MKELRANYPPATDEERRLFRQFRDAAQNFAREAALTDVKVNVTRLNRLAAAADEAEMNYIFVADAGRSMKIEGKINPRLSREVVELLRRRGWTDTRIARTVEASRTLLTRIEAGKESFSPA